MVGAEPEEDVVTDTDSGGTQSTDSESTETKPTMATAEPPKTLQLTSKVDIPPWNSEDPSLWFQMVEDCFTLQRINEGRTEDIPDWEKLVKIGAKIPGEVMGLHKAHYTNKDFEAFKNAICGVASKTEASLYREFTEMKFTEEMTPSAYIQKLLVIAGKLANTSKCRDPRKTRKCDPEVCGGDCGPGNLMSGKEHILLKWLMKNSLETKLPEHMAAVLSSKPFDIDEYLKQADSLYANHQAKTTKGVASVETYVAALSELGADQQTIEAVKRAGKDKKRDNNNNDRPKDQGQNRQTRGTRCRPHHLWGLQAWRCLGGNCADKNRPLAEKPKNQKKKKKEVESVDSSSSND